jgi:multicomponent Na+:H+ antiporter subunit D
MIGLPPTAGFISKWYILLGALDSGKLVIVGVLVLSTLLNAGYYLPIVHAAFFRPPDRPIEHGEAPATMVAAIVVAAAGTVLLFLFPGFALGLAQMVVGAH